MFQDTFCLYLIQLSYLLDKPFRIRVLVRLKGHGKLIAYMRPTEYELTVRGHLRQVLVNHIAIRLYAPEETSQECLYGTAAAAVILLVVIEEISDILQFIHQGPYILLIIMTLLGRVSPLANEILAGIKF